MVFEGGVEVLHKALGAKSSKHTMHSQKRVIRKQILECLDHLVHSLSYMIDCAVYLIEASLPF